MTIFAGLALGLLGSFHCVGMCGPIALAIPHQSQNWLGRIIENLLYNFGRTITYTFLGLLIGMLGVSMRLAGIQNYLSVGFGIILLLYVLIPKKFITISNKQSLISKQVGKFKAFFRKFLVAKGKFSLLVLGLLNGLLPCGLVYIALVESFLRDTLLESALFMTLFGIGTTPIMFVVFASKDLVSLEWRKRINRLIPYAIAIVAILMILRGLSLDIPYISPVLPETVLGGKPSCCE